MFDITADELKNEPLREIEAIVRYVAQQPRCYTPPGLIVALARRKFGAALLPGATQPRHWPAPEERLTRCCVSRCAESLGCAARASGPGIETR
jgi:hypothetical protein